MSFEEAVTVFGDPLARIHEDPEHSEGEAREVIVGHSAARRLLLVFFTDRNDVVRIISTRKADAGERQDYEESI